MPSHYKLCELNFQYKEGMRAVWNRTRPERNGMLYNTTKSGGFISIIRFHKPTLLCHLDSDVEKSVIYKSAAEIREITLQPSVVGGLGRGKTLYLIQ